MSNRNLLFFKLRNDFNLLFVVCHNNRFFLTKIKIDEHGISAKNKNNKRKNQMLIYHCENLNVYSIPTSAREQTATMYTQSSVKCLECYAESVR